MSKAQSIKSYNSKLIIALINWSDALIRQQSNELALKDAALKAMFNSTSWQLTAPLRKAVTLARRRRQRTITCR